MKTLLGIFIGFMLLQGAQASLYKEQHFSYSTGALGAVGFSAGWSNTDSTVTVTTGSLDGTSLGYAPPSGNKVTLTTGSSSGVYDEFSTGITSGSVYWAFLLKVNSTSSLTAAGQPVVGLLRVGSASAYYADVFLGLTGTGIRLGLSKLRGTPQWYGTPLVAGQTYLVVANYQIVSGSGNDVVALWVNPATGGAELSSDVTFASTSDGNTSKGIGRCYIYGNCSAEVDELRIGSTWADVTPGSCVGAGISQNPTNQTVPPGSSASFYCVGTGTGPGYQWQTNNGASWADLSDGAGTASVYTVPAATLAMNGRQYRCVVSVACNTSSVASSTATLTVACVTAGIGSGPSSAQVAAGARATFAVNATGSQPAYQWQTNFAGAWVDVPSGGTNSVYTTEPASVAMNGLQVRCKVSVACDSSSVTSTAATLTVSNAPGSAVGVCLAISPAGNGKVLLSWPSRGQLEAAGQLGGPWTVVTNALASPYTNQPGASAQFFRLNQTVDTTTLHKKVMCGYQGWFKCPGDGGRSWFHWSSSQSQITTNTVTFEMWPEMSEYTNQYAAPGFTYPDGTQAYLFSPQDRQTVDKHFDWMLNYGIGGVFVQRFLVDIAGRPWMTNVLNNVRVAANRTGRAFAITYDMSGEPTNTLFTDLTNDWNRLANSFHVTQDPRYLYHNGKPVLELWGFYHDRMDAALAMQIINYFKSNANVTVIGGGDWQWETDTTTGWPQVFRSFDVISPWNVGNYMTIGTNKYAATNSWSSGIAAANGAGMLWLPVIYPGFSWDNLKHLTPGSSKISRLNGDFLWAQFYDLGIRNVDMAYVAMFDEVDEGTAIFKVSNTPPTQMYFVTYEGMPADWYLRLAAEGSKIIVGERANTRVIPISP